MFKKERIKTIQLGLVSLASFFGLAHAEDQSETLDRYSTLLDSISFETKEGTRALALGSTRPKEMENSVYLSIDTVLWKFKLDGFAYTSKDAILINYPVVTIDKVYEPHMNWDFGVKAGIGYNSCYDGWDAYFEYTYFKNKGHSSRHAIANDELTQGLSILDNDTYQVAAPDMASALLNQSVPGYAGDARSNLSVTLNDFHLELGRDLFLSKRLSVRPNVGVQGLYLKLEQHNTFSGGDFAFAVAAKTLFGIDFFLLNLNDPKILVRKYNHISAVGPRFGVNTNWRIGKGFSMYGDLYQSTLFSYLKRENKATASAYPSNMIKDTYKIHRLLPVTAFELGVSYEHFFQDHTQKLTLRLGYQNQYFFNVCNIGKDLVPDSIGLYGVNFKVRYDF